MPRLRLSGPLPYQITWATAFLLSSIALYRLNYSGQMLVAGLGLVFAAASPTRPLSNAGFMMSVSALTTALTAAMSSGTLIPYVRAVVLTIVAHQ